MIDGKTDGISFWLKPVLSLVPFFLLLSGRRGRAVLHANVLCGLVKKQTGICG